MGASAQPRDPVGDSMVIGADVGRYFASPDLLAKPDIPQLLIGEYASALYELVFERLGPSLSAFCPSVAAQAGRLVGEPLPWSAAWHPDMAEPERLLANPVASQEQVWRTLAPMMVRFAPRAC